MKAIDGSKMICIPAGEFIMGSDDGQHDEKPEHRVYLDTYEIGKYPVTVAQYRKFCAATYREMPLLVRDSKDNYVGETSRRPIANVSWYAAVRYCKWAGGRLPTEAEWEKAARGMDGRTYPWGDTWDKDRCANSELGLSSAAPVGSYPADASPYGCMDMAGNVSEWCADCYAENYYKTSPSRNPKGPSAGPYRVLRGGNWSGNFAPFSCRCACRGRFDHYNDRFGFRLAR